MEPTKIIVPHGLYKLLPVVSILIGLTSLFWLQDFECILGLILVWYGFSVLLLRRIKGPYYD